MKPETGPIVLQRFVNDLTSSRRTFDVADLIDVMQQIVPYNVLVCVAYRQKKAQVPKKLDLIPGQFIYFNYSSFSVQGKDVRRYADPNELYQEVLAYSRRTDLICRATDNYEIYATTNIDTKLLNAIQLACTAFFLLSDPYANYLQNTSRLLAHCCMPSEHLENDLPSIARFMSSYFSVDAGFVALRDPFIKDITKASPSDFVFQFFNEPDVLSSSEQFIRDVTRSLKNGNNFSGRLSVSSAIRYYKTIPISIPTRLALAGGIDARDSSTDVPRYYPVGAFVVIQKGIQIDRICFNTAEELVKEISGTRRISEQLRRVNDLHAEILSARDLITRQPPSTHKEAFALFSDYAQKVVQAIIHLTSAHSATVRYFNPFEGTLAVVAAAFAASLSKESRNSEDIGIPERASLNVFTFSRSNADAVYVPDLSNRSDIDQRALPMALARRAETECELCIRVRKGRVPIGTLNIESPYAYSLGRDRLYCESLSRLLGEFYDVAARTSDAAWLPKISLSHIVHHRIAKVRRSKPQLNKYLDFIEHPLRTQSAPANKKEATIRSILQGIRTDMAPVTDSSWRSLINCRIPLDTRIRREVVPSITIILETLVENWRTYSNDGRDKISVSLDRCGMQVPHQMTLSDLDDLRLKIAYSAHFKRVRLDLLDQLTVSPVWSEEENAYHFGMFLLGAHARLLGGLTYVDTKPTSGKSTRPLKVVILLPTHSTITQKRVRNGKRAAN